MANPMCKGEVVEDFFGFIKLYSDGSVFRSAENPPQYSSDQHPTNFPISHKDIVLDEEKGLWVRIYLPPQSTPNQRFPVIIYFHGGGFCFYSPANSALHHFCLKLASDVGAVVVSVNYRLAPEHRLPAAYEDSISVLQWLYLKSSEQNDPLESHADYSNVFVGGDSAGGNIAHYVGMKLADPANGMFVIRGIMLFYPFFGGEEHTESERRGGGNQVLSLEMSDGFWRLALPPGSNRDHPYCNPLSALRRSHECGIELELPPMVFVIAGGDILRDRQLEYCEVLKNSGKYEMEILVYEEDDHGFTVIKPDDPNSEKVVKSISEFIKEKCCSK